MEAATVSLLSFEKDGLAANKKIAKNNNNAFLIILNYLLSKNKLAIFCYIVTLIHNLTSNQYHSKYGISHNNGVSDF